VLAKLYRAYLSEVTAVAASHPDCVNISIRGDGVLGIFDTRDAESVNRLFEVTAQVLSVVDHLNHLLRVRGYSTIRVGAGLDDGDALLVKAGYAGSAISDTVWLGDVVNRATHLSDVAASAVGDERLMVSERFRRLLKPEYRRLLTWTLSRQCFHGNIYWEPFKRWCNANCLPRLQLRLPPALPPILTPPSLLPPIPLPPPSLSDFFRGPPSGLG
jgi:class 3 adenylate cyclase